MIWAGVSAESNQAGTIVTGQAITSSPAGWGWARRPGLHPTINAAIVALAKAFSDRGITDAKDNIRSSLGQRRRDVRVLIFAKIKATSDDLQVLPLNETEHLELVKKRDHPWCLTSSAGQHA